MRRPRDAQGAERSHLAAIQTEATEDRLLPLGQERPDAAQAAGHAERIDLELGRAARQAASNRSVMSSAMPG